MNENKVNIGYEVVKGSSKKGKPYVALVFTNGDNKIYASFDAMQIARFLNMTFVDFATKYNI